MLMAARPTHPEEVEGLTTVVVRNSLPETSPSSAIAEAPKDEVDVEELLHARLEKHSLDPVDAAWAPGAEKTLSATLRSMANEEFVIKKFECRLQSCVALVEWPSREDAVRTYSTIFRARYEPNCGVTVLIPETKLTGRYQTSVVFDCSESRKGQL